MPVDADAAWQRVAAEPIESPRVGLDIGLPHHRLAREIARERAEHRPVLGRLIVQKIGRHDARRLRHVLNDDGRMSRDMFRQVFGQHAPADIIVAADGVADDHADLPALVEIRRLRERGRRGALRKAEHDQKAACLHVHA